MMIVADGSEKRKSMAGMEKLVKSLKEQAEASLKQPYTGGNNLQFMASGGGGANTSKRPTILKNPLDLEASKRGLSGKFMGALLGATTTNADVSQDKTMLNQSGFNRDMPPVNDSILQNMMKEALKENMVD